MNANANIVDRVEGKSTLVRPRFSPGLLLRDDDLKVGVDYTRELSRLLFQSLFGCGVVCGLRVSVAVECEKLLVTVQPGVALNPMGDPIHVPEPVPIKIDPTCGKEIPAKLWVILCRTEKCCAPRTAVCGCDEEDSPSVCTREQEGFEIRIVKEGPKECACMCLEKPIPPPNDSQDIEGTYDEDDPGCWCADPCKCLNDHYTGICRCKCCDPECVVLAVLTDVSKDQKEYSDEIRKGWLASGQQWLANHSVRRFVRPVLMRDPIVFEEQYPRKDPCKPKNTTPAAQGSTTEFIEAPSTSTNQAQAASAPSTAAQPAIVRAKRAKKATAPVGAAAIEQPLKK